MKISEALYNYLMDLWGYKGVESVDPVTASEIMMNVEVGEFEETALDREFKDAYLKHHKLNPRMSWRKFMDTDLYRQSSSASAAA